MEYSLKRKRALVTGATGLIGGGIARRLLLEGVSVVALIRNPAKATALADLGVELITGDITDLEAVSRAVKGCHIVYHLAGVLNDFQPRIYYHKVNVGATEMLAKAALAAGVERFVHASTILVYGIETIGQVCETSPRITSSDNYADTKLEGEQLILRLVQEQRLPAIVIQPAEVYGPNDMAWTIYNINLIRSGKMFLVNGGTGLVQPIYIDDLIEGIIAATRKGVIGEAYIFGGSELVTLSTFFNYFARMVGKDNLPAVPLWLAHVAAILYEAIANFTHQPPTYTRQRVRYTNLKASYDTSKAEKQLGWGPKTSLSEGMHLVETWLKSQEQQ